MEREWRRRRRRRRPLAPGASSKWAAYIATLPETLDAPLFWTSEQLAELEGTQLLQNAAGYDSYVRAGTQCKLNSFDPWIERRLVSTSLNHVEFKTGFKLPFKFNVCRYTTPLHSAPLRSTCSFGPLVHSSVHSLVHRSAPYPRGESRRPPSLDTRFVSRARAPPTTTEGR